MKKFSAYTYDDWMEYIISYASERKPKCFKPVLYEVKYDGWIFCYELEIPKHFTLLN